MKPRVVIESPLRADTPEGYERNRQYARACMRDSFNRGEAPFASHLMYDQPGILDDTLPEERKLGIQAGLEWGQVATIRAIYVDLGISGGMRLGIQAALELHQRQDFRSIASWRPSGAAYKAAVTACSECCDEGPCIVHAFGPGDMK